MKIVENVVIGGVVVVGVGLFVAIGFGLSNLQEYKRRNICMDQY